VQLDRVELGDAAVHNLRGCAVSLAAMHKAGLNDRGLLGLNFLGSYRLTIVFSRRTLRVEPPTAVSGSARR
jgi:hypothetical protein